MTEEPYYIGWLKVQSLMEYAERLAGTHSYVSPSALQTTEILLLIRKADSFSFATPTFGPAVV